MERWIAFILIAAVLVVAAVWDWRTHRIPNALTYGAILAAILFWAGMGLAGRHPLPAGGHSPAMQALIAAGWSVAGALAGLVPMYVIFALGGMGGGDVKMMAFVGAALSSPTAVLDAAVYTFVASLLLSIGVMIYHRVVRQTLQRVFLAFVALLLRTKPDLPTDSPRVPFAVATLVGGTLAWYEHVLRRPLPWTSPLGP